MTANTEKIRELWKSEDGRVRVTLRGEGGLGIEVSGSVLVMPPERWHNLAHTLLADGVVRLGTFCKE